MEVDCVEQLVERAAQRVQTAQVALIAQRGVGQAVFAGETGHLGGFGFGFGLGLGLGLG